MKAHIIENNLVINTIEVDDLTFPVSDGQTLIEGSEGGIGWAWDGTALIAPPTPEPPPAPIPRSITKAQGQAQLALEGKYQAVVDYIAAIADPTQRLLANIAFNSTNDWYLDSPFLNQTATDLGWLSDPAYLDTFFINASAIKL